MRKISKVIALTLSLALTLPSTALGTNGNDLVVSPQTLTQEYLKKYDLSGLATINEDIKENPEQDYVRIIVETDVTPEVNSEVKDGFATKVVTNSDEVNEKIDSVLSSAKNLNIQIEPINKFNTLFSGFSAEVKSQHVDSIKKINGVSNVYISNKYTLPVVKPDMASSYGLINNRELWEKINVKGQGKVVAVLDTGIDSDHKDFQEIDKTKTKLKQTDVEQIMENNGLSGLFLTDKVPFSYNYFDNSLENKDLGSDASMHGMHVAGTVGANGADQDLESGKSIKGVAPEAQLLNMKVFGNEGVYSTTYTDIYMKAIEDSVILGADVVNMSLGSEAGTNTPDDILNQTINNATRNGVDVVISAGNSSHTYYGHQDHQGLPFAIDPDYGVVGSPSVATQSTSVASYENISILRAAIEIKHRNATGEEVVSKFPYATSSPVSPVGVKGELVFLGTGTQNDYDTYLAGGNTLQGKIVVVQRGQNFVETQKRSQDNGAAAHIVYNRASGGSNLVSMAINPGQTIPNLFIPYDAGMLLQNASFISLDITENLVSVTNPNFGKLSDFTSKGSTPSLEMKPEIAAPGGNIFSTVNDNEYETMSGTSMAAPHIAGGYALIRQLMEENEKFADVAKEDKAKFAKTLLMNNSRVLTDHNTNVPFSVRYQGAGSMDLSNVVDTTLTAVHALTKEPKVELKEFTENQITIPLELRNLTDQTQNYEVDLTVIKDKLLQSYNLMTSEFLTNSFDKFDVSLEPKQTKTIDVSFTIDFNGVENQFAEGWVHIRNKADGHTVNVPFMGFYGSWSAPRVLDTINAQVDENNDLVKTESYFGISAIYFKGSNGFSLYNPNVYAISPNTPSGTAFGTAEANLVLSFLRNSQMLNINILNENKELVALLNKSGHQTKNFFAQGRRNPYVLKSEWKWNGTARGRQVEDGKYFYEIVTKPYGQDNVQKSYVPIFVDTVSPLLKKARYDDNKKLYVTASDELSGLFAFIVTSVNKTTNQTETALFKVSDLADPVKNNYEIDLTKLIDKLGQDEFESRENQITVADNAMNLSAGFDLVKFETKYDIPWLYVLTPDLLEIYNNKEVPLTGYVIDDEKPVVSYTVNSRPAVEVTTQTAKDLAVKPSDPNSQKANGFKFDPTTITLDEGYNLIKVKAYAALTADKEATSSREVYVDTIKPELTLVEYDKVVQKPDFIKVKVKVKEQAESFEIYANGEKVFFLDKFESMRKPKPVDAEFNIEVPLYENGEFPVELYVTDVAGNKSDIVNFVVNKPDPEPELNGWHKVDGKTKYYVNNVAVKGWFELDGNKYYFDEETEFMVTGWKRISGHTYLFYDSGKMVKGWKKMGKYTYLFYDSGKMVTGWKKLGDNTYLFYDNGRMVTGWKDLLGSRYHFDERGKMTKGWFKEDDKTYYFRTNGKMAVGKVKIGNKYYNFDKNGVLLNP